MAVRPYPFFAIGNALQLGAFNRVLSAATPSESSLGDYESDIGGVTISAVGTVDSGSRLRVDSIDSFYGVPRFCAVNSGVKTYAFPPLRVASLAAIGTASATPTSVRAGLCVHESVVYGAVLCEVSGTTYVRVFRVEPDFSTTTLWNQAVVVSTLPGIAIASSTSGRLLVGVCGLLYESSADYLTFSQVGKVAIPGFGGVALREAPNGSIESRSEAGYWEADGSFTSVRAYDSSTTDRAAWRGINGASWSAHVSTSAPYSLYLYDGTTGFRLDEAHASESRGVQAGGLLAVVAAYGRTIGIIETYRSAVLVSFSTWIDSDWTHTGDGTNLGFIHSPNAEPSAATVTSAGTLVAALDYLEIVGTGSVVQTATWARTDATYAAEETAPWLYASFKLTFPVSETDSYGIAIETSSTSVASTDRYIHGVGFKGNGTDYDLVRVSSSTYASTISISAHLPGVVQGDSIEIRLRKYDRASINSGVAQWRKEGGVWSAGINISAVSSSTGGAQHRTAVTLFATADASGNFLGVRSWELYPAYSSSTLGVAPILSATPIPSLAVVTQRGKRSAIGMDYLGYPGGKYAIQNLGVWASRASTKTVAGGLAVFSVPATTTAGFALFVRGYLGDGIDVSWGSSSVVLDGPLLLSFDSLTSTIAFPSSVRAGEFVGGFIDGIEILAHDADGKVSLASALASGTYIVQPLEFARVYPGLPPSGYVSIDLFPNSHILLFAIVPITRLGPAWSQGWSRGVVANETQTRRPNGETVRVAHGDANRTLVLAWEDPQAPSGETLSATEPGSFGATAATMTLAVRDASKREVPTLLLAGEPDSHSSLYGSEHVFFGWLPGEISLDAAAGSEDDVVYRIQSVSITEVV